MLTFVKPESQQVTSQKKGKLTKKKKGTWADSIILWAPPPPAQLFSMKETTDNKVPLVKKS